MIEYKVNTNIDKQAFSCKFYTKSFYIFKESFWGLIFCMLSLLNAHLLTSVHIISIQSD